MRYSEEKIMEMLCKCRVDLSNQDIIELINSKNDLINRLKAENERLTRKTMEMAITIETCQADAIKEFEERLKEKAYLNDRRIYVVLRDDIDDVKKEMVGEE